MSKSDQSAPADAEQADYLAFRAEWHNRRLAKCLAEKGMTLTGLRVHPAGDLENGTVVTLAPDEAAVVMDTLIRVIAARVAE